MRARKALGRATRSAAALVMVSLLGQLILTPPSLTAQQQPILQVSPTSLSFAGQAGGPVPDPQYLTLANAGGGIMEWEASKDADWIILGASEGKLSGGRAIQLLVWVDIEGLEAGEYQGTVTISAEGAQGSPVHVEVSLTLSPPPNRPPIAQFTYSPTQPEVGESVRFDASSSSDPDGRIVKYEWDFGDGATVSSSLSYYYHSYSSARTYTVKLTVTDDDGLTDSTSRTITVKEKPKPPVARFTYSPSQPEVGESVRFDASSSSDPDGRIVKYEWDFGDGVTRSTSQTYYYHSYSSARTYTVKLTVTDDDGLTGSTSRTITVKEKPKPPVARFTYSPTQPEVGESVQFDASSSSDPDGRIVKYEWDFGDGVTRSTSQTYYYHSYSSARTYTVKLTVTDDDGLTNSTSKTVTVREKPNQPPQASFSYSPSYLHVADKVSLDASGSRDPDGTITRYKWSFGDGSSGSGREISHRYGRQGSYTVRLTVTDNRGGTDTASHTITVRSLTSNPWRGSKNVHLIFNCQYPPYNITAFRQAVAVMIDREEVTGQVRGVSPAYSIVPSGNSYWRDSSIKRWGEGMSLSRRIQTAVSLLKSAGFRWEEEPTATRYGRGLIMPNGQTLGEQALMHPNAADDNAANLFGMMIAKWLNMLGIPVRVEPSSINAIWGSVEEGYFDMAIVPWDFGSSGFPQYLYNLFASSQVPPEGLNYSGYESSEYDDVALEFLHASSDSGARTYAYKLQEILAKEVPHVVLYERRW